MSAQPATTETPERERIVKDDGRVYVPRKPVALHPLGEGADFALVVLRTHDEARYRDRAADVWEQYQDSVLPPVQRVWVRLVPWDPTGAYDSCYQWVSSTARGAVPALWYERG